MVWPPTVSALARTATPAPVIDEEYDRYKKKGDDFFREGKYLEARWQYENCLEVPGFENDPYALKQIETSAAGLALRQQVDEAMSQGKSQQVVDLLYQLLNLNPEDAITKNQFSDHYEREGNRLFNQGKLRDARNNYTTAIEFASANKAELLREQVRNIDQLLLPVYPKQTGLKAAAGSVAIGSMVTALVLHANYRSKLRALNQIGQSLDPNGTGIIDSPIEYREYDNAYAAANAAKKKQGLFTVFLGVAAVATAAEVYLFLHKPKPRPPALSWQPSSDSWGLAIRYSF
ncbi:hypothetical protein GCM10028804_15500 [Larkinella terrae]